MKQAGKGFFIITLFSPEILYCGGGIETVKNQPKLNCMSSTASILPPLPTPYAENRASCIAGF